MNNLGAVLGYRYLGTTVQSWLVAAAIAFLVTTLLTLLRRAVIGRLRRWAERSTTPVDDLLVSAFASLRFLFFVAIGLWLATEYVSLSDNVRTGFRVGVLLLTWLQLGLTLQAAVRKLSRRWGGADEDGEAKTMASAIGFLSSLLIWSAMVVAALSTLGFKISALLAGLGVGGVAAALAVQSILGDLFASLSIYFDRPFNLGDFIVVGNEKGTVEKIGLRTTRIRALGGEEIVFANGDLTKSRIHNFKRMQDRRVTFRVGVDYQTRLEDLREIPNIVKSIVEAREGARFERAHFRDYGEFSLDFEVAYQVLSTDFNAYLDHQHAINLEIFREFAERKIQFAGYQRRVQLTRPRVAPTGATAPAQAGDGE